MILPNDSQSSTSYQYHQQWDIELRPAFQDKYRQKVQTNTEGRDNQLYQLCRQLTHQNRVLKKENVQLKKEIQKLVNQDHNSNIFIPQKTCQLEEYRQINYENYKKKAMKVLNGLKYLFSLYTERQRVAKRDMILETMMDKMSKGGSNLIIELVRSIDGVNAIQQIDGRCDLDDFVRQASEYQNHLLRKHLNKMNRILVQSIYKLRRDLSQLQTEVANKKQKIDEEVKYYCTKYLPLNQNQNVKSQRVSHKKKVGKKSKENIEVEKVEWKEVVNQRAKLQEKKKHYSGSFIKGLEINTEDQGSHISYSIPLSRGGGRPPKPTSTSHSINLKCQTTLTDQLQSSKNTRHSLISGATPKSRASELRPKLKESTNKKKNQNNQSTNNSGRKYYR